jgi:peptidoglycan-associated lipoprotein
MQKFRPALAAGLVALAAGALSLGACATEDYVKKQVGSVDTELHGTQAEVAAQQAALQAHDARLGQLDKTSQDALDRATAAGKLAEGKFLYSMVLSDDSVKFPVDSSKLSPEAEARLMDFVQKLKADNRNVYIEIQGHTDATGPQTLNERLGEERAEAVRLFMNQQGVALNRLSTISYGDKAPVAPNTTRQGRAQNRRVVVIVLA